jgi:hypothetical protein
MARDRDYAEEYRRSNELARAIGYESAAERRHIKSAGSAAEMRERLEPVVQARANEMDYQSLGQIFRDLYESYDYDMEQPFEDMWDDMEY